MNAAASSAPGHLGSPVDIGDEGHEVVIEILAAGWKRALARPEVRPDAKEVPLSECLRDGMREALGEWNAEWALRVIILPGTESRSSAGVLVPDGLTDIPVLFTDIREMLNEHDPHAIIECKRVAADDADLCRLYVRDGIDDRFRSGKYASRHATGFMAGYVLAGSVAAVVDLINGRLSRLRAQTRTLGHMQGH